MNFRHYKLGVVPSRHDSRDYKINKFFAARTDFPEEFRIQERIDNIYDQGYVGSCVAFSLKAIKELQELKERKVFTEYSPGFIYLNRFKKENGGSYQHTYMGEGMEPRDALKSLQLDGVCEYSLFPYNVAFSEYDKYPIPPEAFAHAYPQRISYYFAVETVNEIKQALIDNGPVQYCIPVYDCVYDVGKDGLIGTPIGSISGYHSMVIEGWRSDNRWIVRNSWSKDWGDNGFGYFPFSYPISEAWGITDSNIRQDVIELWIGKKYVRINGILFNDKLDQAPIIDPKTNRTLVPVRFISEAFGCKVDWDQKEKRINITKLS